MTAPRPTSEQAAAFIDGDVLHEAARRATGFAEFGTDDYLVALRVLLEATACSPAAGEELTRRVTQFVVEALAGRACSQEGWRRRPECLTEAVAAPVIITGLPRTGTTALHQLLAVDPQFQWLPNWLAPRPRERPPRASWETDPEFQHAMQAFQALRRANPALVSVHPVTPADPAECIGPMTQSLISMRFVTSLPLPHYYEWFIRADETESYRRYADNLRLIGAETPGQTWLLKNPSHIMGMSSLLDVFPDARIVFTHRDPAVAIPSGCSLVRIGTDGLWKDDELGPHRVLVWSEGIRRAEQARQLHPDNFFDVHYDRFVDDPVGAVRAIYDRFDLRLSADTEAAMRDWTRQNPGGGESHRYTAEEFGLSATTIRDEFSTYIERRGVLVKDHR